MKIADVPAEKPGDDAISLSPPSPPSSTITSLESAYSGYSFYTWWPLWVGGWVGWPKIQVFLSRAGSAAHWLAAPTICGQISDTSLLQELPIVSSLISSSLSVLSSSLSQFFDMHSISDCTFMNAYNSCCKYQLLCVTAAEPHVQDNWSQAVLLSVHLIFVRIQAWRFIRSGRNIFCSKEHK